MLNGMSFSHEKGHPAVCDNVGEPGRPSVKQAR